MRPRGQLVSTQGQVCHKPQVGPPEPVLAPIPNQPRNGQNTLGPKIGQEPQMATIQSMASGNQQRPPAQLKERIPLKFRGRLFLSQCTPHLRIHEWGIYGIIYHYAPFLLRNTMVMFSGPNYVLQNQVSNPSPIFKEDISAIQSGNSLVATRRPFEDPNHLVLHELGCQFSSGLF
ncbi:hypothetical protein O181_126323 [Austropuccinia psidii MF-1]|uniref:Uncharacterized protein n=1 Tax=Austropuccinia psidii MF-1 TaxID=1389203 RepID=A0A9Q3Q5W3_9BASI|nr:hypothetical protein [Austropuccinia psidii MF-1]